MQQYKVQRTIPAPKSKIWSLLDDFGNIHMFSPGVSASSLLEGPNQGVGAKRKCEFYDGAGHFIESVGAREEGKLLRVDVDEMQLKQEPPIKNFQIFFELSSGPDSGSLVTATGHYETIGLLGKIMNVLIIRKKLRKGVMSVLDGLALHIETGAEIGPNLKVLTRAE